MLITAILVVNNLRDIETDARAGKRTLAVRLGDARTSHEMRKIEELTFDDMRAMIDDGRLVVAQRARGLFTSLSRRARRRPTSRPRCR